VELNNLEWLFDSLQDIFPVGVDIPNVPSTLPGIRDKKARAAPEGEICISAAVNSLCISHIDPTGRRHVVDYIVPCFFQHTFMHPPIIEAQGVGSNAVSELLSDG
jgi:hypothetical protein